MTLIPPTDHKFAALRRGVEQQLVRLRAEGVKLDFLQSYFRLNAKGARTVSST